jgi:hypothetical protein
MYSKAGNRVINNLAPDSYSEPVMASIRNFGTGSQLHLNSGDLNFAQRGNQWRVNDIGWVYGTTLADLNNDGFLDIYATAGFMSRRRDKPDT